MKDKYLTNNSPLLLSYQYIVDIFFNVSLIFPLSFISTSPCFIVSMYICALCEERKAINEHVCRE